MPLYWRKALQVYPDIGSQSLQERQPVYTEKTKALKFNDQGCCGTQIIGGHEVTPHSRPYMVSVDFEGRHHCGGFLLHVHWVVSAAHYLSDRDPSTGLVVLGAHALLKTESTRQVFSIAAVVQHPGYQPATQANDICLLMADSGGPLICGSQAHGIVSFSGLWCGDPKTPDVYTQVSAFVA
ncbi:hypothetical protein STEG23_003277 [Scotinomys teguina]